MENTMSSRITNGTGTRPAGRRRALAMALVAVLASLVASGCKKTAVAGVGIGVGVSVAGGVSLAAPACPPSAAPAAAASPGAPAASPLARVDVLARGRCDHTPCVCTWTVPPAGATVSPTTTAVSPAPK